ncbi:hypothetical protein [Pseudoflavonifractor phocaeensis]|uniref:hypothetical protein n=1 Tax=Pseudoflavonifractor phocaeensis TaxID=1870988 RepID=UPI00195CB045|nr:hypothetical protein [Pseudoflavonifractor phocaeensis]MBM6724912.1 hypothetical protein [Pseudoflavonifractor phocaeensis]
MSIFTDRVRETYNVACNLLGTSIWRLCASQVREDAAGYHYRIFPKKLRVTGIQIMEDHMEFVAGNEAFVYNNGELISTHGALAGLPIKGITDWSQVPKEAEVLRGAVKTTYKKVATVELSNECLEVNTKSGQDGLTKDELRLALEGGTKLVDMFYFQPGQECEIFKAERFRTGDEIIYIPDLSLNEIPIDMVVDDPEAVEDILDNCYTGNDFLEVCGGDRDLAERLFHYVDWQHPSSALPEVEEDEDDE